MNTEIISSFEFDDDKLLQSLTEVKAAVDALRTAQNEMKRNGQEASAQFVENAARLKELNAEYNEGLKILNNRQRAAAIDIDNYSKEGKSIRELRKETQDLIKVRNEMRINGEQNSAAFERLNAIIDDNTETIKANVSAYEKQKMNIGNYSQGIVDAWERIKSGDVKGAVDQIGELGEAWRANYMTIGGAWKQIVAIPVAGWIAGITAVLVMGFNQMIQYNNHIRELEKEVSNITKLQGDALSEVAIKAEALQESVLGLDMTETLESAKALVNEFGISYQEALQTIEDGAIRGGAANKEYLESIREYPAFFAQAGYSAQEFINVVNAGYDLGIYNDKLPDAIKEFNLSIREQTKSTRDALVNAFGAPFADEILKKVSEGKITTKQALEEIANESEKYNLTQKQQAQLTADIFRGAGEDAGGFVKIMAAVRKSVEDANRPLTETEKILKQQTDAYEEMKEEKDKALRSDTILAFRQEFEVAKIKIATWWYQLVQVFRDVDKAVQQSAGFVRGAFTSIPQAAANAFNAVLEAMKGLMSGFQSGGKAISLFFKGEFEAAANEASKFASTIPATMARIKGAFSGFAKDVSAGAYKESRAVGRQYDARTSANAEIFRKTETSEGKPTNNFDGTAGAKSTKPSKSKSSGKSDKSDEAEKETKRLMDIADKAREDAIKNFEAELDHYVKMNTSKIEGAKFLTNALIDIEQKREQDILDKKIEMLAKIRDKELENTKLTADEKKRINDDYLEKLKSAQDEFEKNTAANTQAISEQQAEWNKEYAIAQQQEKLKRLEEEGAGEYELKRAQLEEQKAQDQELQAAEKELQLLANEEEDAAIIERKAFLESKITDIEADYSQKRADIDFQEKQAKLSMAADVAGAVAQIAGKETAVGKAAAIAQATINTYQGATLALKSYPGPVGIAMAALTVASGLMSVGKIVGINTGEAASGFNSLATLTGQAAQKFGAGKSGKKAERGIVLEGNSHASGGLNLYDQYGNHVVEAEGGELLAVINKRSTLAMLSAANVAGGGIPLSTYVRRAANGGMIGASISSSNFDQIRAMSEAVYNATIEGTYQGSQRGLRDLSTDRQIRTEATI